MNGISLGGGMLALAVIIGAFGAHALTDVLVGPRAAWFQTASDYHFWHGLGLLIIGVAKKHASNEAWHRWSARFMVIGLVLFSGCLYAMALTGTRILGAVVPAGGLSFILGWCCLVMAFQKPSSP